MTLFLRLLGLVIGLAGLYAFVGLTPWTWAWGIVIGFGLCAWAELRETHRIEV